MCKKHTLLNLSSKLHTNYNTGMAKPLTPEQRIKNAAKLIEEARNIPRPASVGWDHFSYTAQVKDTLKKAFELIKLIQHSPSADKETKRQAKDLMDSLPEIEREILKPS
jgi:hypothetical protein